MNDHNLRPGEYKFSQEQVKKGQINSAKARREKRKLKEIVNNILGSSVKDIPAFNELAKKLDFDCEKSVKELYSFLCLLNSAANGGVNDLEKLAKLIDEAPNEEIDLNVRHTPFERL